jgi:SRSO17 transposase
LVEARDDGQVQHALSNLPAVASLLGAVRLWKQRWRVEQGHQQMKEELGWDHSEGRSWRGSHHAAMVMLADCALGAGAHRTLADRLANKGRSTTDSVGRSSRAATALAAAGKTDCPYCHDQRSLPLIEEC